MKNKLEDFIQQNREAFDDKVPPHRIWKKVEASVIGQSSVWHSLTIWRAAAVLFMALSVYLLLTRQTNSKPEQHIVLNEFNDVEAFYIQQISDKVQLIDEFNHSTGLNGFTRDFHQLEAMYMVLKEEFKTRPSKKVKDALILNLLVRIDLLNQQLDRLDQDSDDGEEDEEEEEERKDSSI